MSAPGTKKLVDAAPMLTVEEGVGIVRKGLDFAARFEGRGLAWHPNPNDFAIDDAKQLILAETNGVNPLEYPARFDVTPLLVALGSSLVPSPLAFAPSSIVRMLLPHGPVAAKRIHSVDEARKAIDAIDLKQPYSASENAALADIGLWRDHNDDVALVCSGGARDASAWHALVLCDGVSSVAHAAGAAAVAARAARDEIARGVAAPSDPKSIVLHATRVADAAVRKLSSEMRAVIGTTIVSALVRGDELAVAWVGDSRAFWVTDRGEEQLTTDHAEGRQLTSCLGMVDSDGRAAAVAPSVVTRTLGKKGALILCSDGLWNYFPTASAIAHLTQSVQYASKNSLLYARFLVNSALAAGGADNVSVAVHLRGTS
jgi:serine/threonine protein phosphatase PrpC